MKFTITAKDYNEIVKLGKLFAAGKLYSRESLQYIHLWVSPGEACVELFAESSDGHVYGCVNAQFESYEDDHKQPKDFLLPATITKAFAGSTIEFNVGDDQIVIREIQKNDQVLTTNIKKEFAGVYPDFKKVLPDKETSSKAQIFSGKTFAKLAGFFGSDEQFNVWFRETALYLGNENKICVSMAVKRGEIENVLRR